ncbi:MAG: aldo/keto reductase [Phycisphaeraceae bacterium]|nr:aldo/keto reductase [Phycisphaeraceae bacterium]
MPDMPSTTLGRSGLRVSRLGLGGIPFGNAISVDDAQGVLDRYVEAGGNLVDTANIYGGGFEGTHEQNAGTSERAIGRIIKGRRDRLVVATKGYWTMRDPARPEGVGLHRKHLSESLDASLRRLDVDHIDLYQCHAWDFYSPVDETVQVLDEFVRAGKIRFAGVSNWPGWGAGKAATVARLTGVSSIVSNQVWYNLADRVAEADIVPACRDEQVSIIAWGALAQGWLTGTCRRGDTGPPQGSPIAASEDVEPSSWESLAIERNWALLDQLEQIARRHDRAMATVAIRWMLQAGQADVILLGGAEPSHYVGLLDALEFALPDEDVAALTEITRLRKTYPHSFIDLFCRRESPMFGGLRRPQA